MTAKDIIEKIMEYKGMSAPSLASRLGITAQNIYDMQNGRISKISPRLRAIIAREMPEINQSWLIEGKGDMLVSPSIVQNIEQKNSSGSIHNTTSTDSQLASVVLEQSKQISKLIEIIDRLTHGDRDRAEDK